jgi:TrmH family RNA methyltransferase
MPITLGLHAPQLEAVRTLRTKAGRTAERRFAIEGATLLAEALQAGRRPEAVYATQAGYAALGPLALEVADRTFLVPERAFARLSDLDTPPGILAVLPLVLGSLDEAFATGEPGLLLAGVADPGNAGTLLRSAEIFGIRTAIFGALGVDAHAPKVVRATMGAFFRMTLATATPAELLEAAHRHGYAVVAARRSGVPLPEFVFPARSVIAIGNERHGTESWLPASDFGVSIPQAGTGESLNAAVAGAIICYAFAQQLAPSNK